MGSFSTLGGEKLVKLWVWRLID